MEFLAAYVIELDIFLVDIGECLAGIRTDSKTQ